MKPKRTYAYDPDCVVAPSETLREWIDKMGLRAVRIAAACVGGLPDGYAEQLLQDVLDRKPLTSEHTLLLEQITIAPAQLWLSLEHNYRVGLAAGKSDVSNRMEEET